MENSNLNFFSNAFSETDNSVDLRRHTNTSCVKCDVLEKEMILIGVFVMCNNCWEEEFNVVRFKTDSELYKNKYKKWCDILYNK